MTTAEAVARIQTMTGCTDTALLTILYEDAVSQILAYTHRKKLPDALQKTARDIAVMAYNRMGTEGEASRSGAGESDNFEELPASVYKVLDSFRLARVGGTFFEGTSNEA